MIFITNLQRTVPISVSKIKSAAQKALKHLKFKEFGLSIVFVGTRRMRRLNKQYLGHDYVTDVITFDDGEIVICPAVAVRNAKAYGHSVERELVLYVAHGLLHLAGYDDHTLADIKKMRAKEQEILHLQCRKV